MPCCCETWIAELARAHTRRLAAIARREGVPAADALDIVQDAFHTLLAMGTRPDEPGRVLAAIVRNAARNARRRHHRAKPHVDVDAAALAITPAPPDPFERAQLAGCMTELADVHRDVIALRVLEELSGDEAAAALGLTPGHVAVLLHRARKQLERCMQAG